MDESMAPVAKIAEALADETIIESNITVLIGIEDIAPVPVDQLGQSGHEPTSIGTRHQKRGAPSFFSRFVRRQVRSPGAAGRT